MISWQLLRLGNQLVSIMDSGHVNLLNCRFEPFRTENGQNAKKVRQLR